MNASAEKFYGTAQRVFLEKLTKSIHKDKNWVKDRIIDLMNEFMERHNVDRQSGYIVRMAKRFALTYAAGVIAVKYKVLPFTEEDVINGVSKCYQDTLSARPPSINELVSDARKSVIKALKSRDYLDIGKKDHGYSCEEVQSANIFRTIIKGKEVRILTSDYLFSLIGNDLVVERLLEQFVNEGRLFRDAERKNTRPFSTKIMGCKLPRAYVFLSKKDALPML